MTTLADVVGSLEIVTMKLEGLAHQPAGSER